MARILDLLDAVDKANPSEADIDALRVYLENNPDKLFIAGDMAIQAEHAVIRNALSTQKGAEISTQEYCKHMRLELGYHDASALEKSLIRHVVLCWLRLNICESRYEMNLKDATLTQGAYWEKKLSANQTRYLRAVETLAKIRKLGVSVQINIADKQIVTG